jgi:glycosyltransferase involved in cell wall biosynthesis
MISIIIPTYNRGSLLIQAVNSCLAQTYINIEIIIIDDGSTDTTEEMVKQLLLNEWKSRPIRYYKQDNSGASAARNQGIRYANGEFIQFLDSDDLLHPEKLRKQIECIEHNKVKHPEVCSCYGVMGDSFQSIFSTRIGIKCSTPHEYIINLCSLIVHGMQTSAPLWNSLFIKSQLGWRDDISFGDDLEYHIRLLSKTNNVVFVDQELFLVRVHKGERLSNINCDQTKITSSFMTKQSIIKTLKEENLWNIRTQTIFLSSLKTTYANILELSSEKQINDFETWLFPLISSPRNHISFRFLIYFRKYFGKYLILKIHKLLMKIR